MLTLSTCGLMIFAMARQPGRPNSSATYHHGDLHNALVDAAIALIRQDGPNALSLRAVARQAGVSHTAPYRHFADKHALLETIALGGFRELSRAMKSAAENYADPLQQIIHAGEAYIRLATQNPEVTQIMFGGFLEVQRCGEALQQESEQAFAGLLAIIEKGKRSGQLKPMDTEVLALATWSLAHGFAMLVAAGQLAHKVRDSAEVQALSQSLGELLVNGIRA